MYCWGDRVLADVLERLSAECNSGEVMLVLLLWSQNTGYVIWEMTDAREPHTLHKAQLYHN